MTDTRYQRDLNSLVRENRRRGLAGIPAANAVRGGAGYAGKSEDQPVLVDQLHWARSADILLSPAPDPGFLTPTFIRANTSVPVYMTNSRGALYTVSRAGGYARDIQRNDIPFGPGSSYWDQVGNLHANTSELLVTDIGLDDDYTTLHFLDRFTGEIKRELLSGAPWQLTGVGMRVDDIACNDTHIALAITGGSRPDLEGLWIYNLDFSLVQHVLRDDFPAYLVAITADRIYLQILEEQPFAVRIRVYDLTGAELDNQTITFTDTSSNFPGKIQANPWALWAYSSNVNFETLFYYPRIAASELFDDAARVSYQEAAAGTSYAGAASVDHDFTLEY